MNTIWTRFRQACQEHAARPATLQEGVQECYAEFFERVRRLAAALHGRGLCAGDRVAILDLNSAEYLAAYFAAAGLGLILQPLNHRLAVPEWNASLQDSEARLLLLGAPLAQLRGSLGAQLALELGILDLVPACGHGGPTAGLEAALGVARSEDVAQLYYTSGTTGEPKGVMLTHANVCAHADAVIAELELTASDRWGHFAPLFHLADAWATFAITQVGGLHVIQRRFEAAQALALIEAARISLSNLVPSMLTGMVASARSASFDPSSLRMILSGGAPITPALVRRIIECFRCEYVQTYGMTETSPYLTLSLLPAHLRELPEERALHYRSRTGRRFSAVELELVNPEGQRVPADDRSVGEIRVRGASVSPGYWRRPAETAASFRGGWLYTGDLAVIDAEGFVDIVDRRADMILSGGENVYSIEVEKVLAEHPAVQECAAFGQPDETWGERVCAAVVLRPGLRVTAEQLEAFCSRALGRFKLPKSWIFLESLPKTGSGKVSKSALRARAE